MDIDPAQPSPVRVGRKASAIAGARLRNRVSKASILGDAPVAVSLTSYGERLHIVADVIETIARSKPRPRRFVLWVDDPTFDVSGYPALERLTRRGLEIRLSENYGPHTKNYPYCREFADDGLALVTADDDIIYPRGWLAGLVAHQRRHPEEFLGYRAHRVTFTPGGDVADYAQWEPEPLEDPTPRTFITGVAGAVFPPALQRAMREAGDVFMKSCPRADDVWINLMALRAGVAARRVDGTSMSLLSYPRSQEGALHHDNVGGGGNDVQMKATVTPHDVELMHAGKDG